MTTWTLRKTVTHPKLKKPVVSEFDIDGKIDRVVRRLFALTSQQQYELKRGREVSWVDELGGTITLSVFDKKTAPKKSSGLKKLWSQMAKKAAS